MSTRHIVLGSLVAIAGILVLLTGILSQIIAVGVLGFVIMGAGVYWATTRRAGAGSPRSRPGNKPASSSKGGFMANLEERWDERHHGEDR